MPRFNRMQVLNAMLDGGIVPIFHHPDLETMKEAVRACDQAGIRVFEMTNRGDGAHEVFSGLEKFCARELPRMILGAGTVVDSGIASLYINSGASFIVSPVLNPDTARTCNRRKIPHIPGVATLTEISQAEELGCEIVKLFPAGEIGGASYLAAIKGPCPWTSVMASGGVELSEKSLGEWFGAGAACVAVGGSLFSREAIQKKDFAGITAKLAAGTAVIRKIRGK
jgi:2-dehydro-3-deoxyphosphogluconate aldolase/(4S)-4-hydroxy-2-oxoglutarate aldolase